MLLRGRTSPANRQNHGGGSLVPRRIVSKYTYIDKDKKTKDTDKTQGEKTNEKNKNGYVHGDNTHYRRTFADRFQHMGARNRSHRKTSAAKRSQPQSFALKNSKYATVPITALSLNTSTTGRSIPPQGTLTGTTTIMWGRQQGCV